MQPLSLVHKEYKVLDIMKFVMAIVVVAIHTRPELSFSSPIVVSLYEAVYAIAVPFFFMASGFLLFRKISLPLNEEGEQRIKSYLKKICKLYLIWTGIYLPLTVYGFYQDGLSLLNSIAIFFRNILLIGENYMSWPLWYLLALIVAVGIIYVLLKLKLSKNWVVVLGILMAIIGVALNYCKSNSIFQPVTDLYFSLFQKTRNGFFVGFLYVSLGMFCSKLDKASLWHILLIFLIGFIGMYLALPLANSLVVFALFVISIAVRGGALSSYTSQDYRHLSSIIYFCHMLWMALLVLCCGLKSGFLLFAITTILSIITGIAFLRKKGTKLFNLLFN
jgi:surface polysaccharide O-acyltransferase-like enzyme